MSYTGLAAMYLRLQFHSKAVQLPPELTSGFDETIRKLIHLPYEIEISSRRLSPIETEVGAAVLEIMRQLSLENSTSTSRLADRDQLRWVNALRILKGNINAALEHDRHIRSGGGCEVLYGRAGLLWTLINLRRLCDDAHLGTSRRRGSGGGRRSVMLRKLAEYVRDEVLQVLVDMIVSAGKKGAEMYEEQYGERPVGMRLIWNWHDAWYLGA